MNRKQIKSEARTLIDKNSIKLIGGSALFNAFRLLLVNTPFFAPFRTAFRKFLIKISEGKNPKMSEILNESGHMYARSFWLEIFKIVLIFVWNLPSVILYTVSTKLVNAESIAVLLLGGDLDPKLLLALGLIIIAGLWSIAITVYKLISYSMTDFVLADGYSNSAIKCVQRSKELTNGNFFEIVKLYFSFILWELIGLVSLFVMQITYISQYKELTYVLFYETLKKESSGINNANNSRLAVANAVRNPVILGLTGMYSGVQFNLQGNEELVIGRDGDQSQIVISEDGEKVSRKHCSIRFNTSEDRYYVVDYSQNGTFLSNSTKLPQNIMIPVARGSEIYLGNRNNSFLLQ